MLKRVNWASKLFKWFVYSWTILPVFEPKNSVRRKFFGKLENVWIIKSPNLWMQPCTFWLIWLPYSKWTVRFCYCISFPHPPSSLHFSFPKWEKIILLFQFIVSLHEFDPWISPTRIFFFERDFLFGTLLFSLLMFFDRLLFPGSLLSSPFLFFFCRYSKGCSCTTHGKWCCWICNAHIRYSTWSKHSHSCAENSWDFWHQ